MQESTRPKRFIGYNSDSRPVFSNGLLGICECVYEGSVTPEEAEVIRAYAKSETKIWGFDLRYYAIAALHLLGIEEYTGDDKNVLRLIKELPNFVP